MHRFEGMEPGTDHLIGPVLERWLVLVLVVLVQEEGIADLVQAHLPELHNILFVAENENVRWIEAV